MTSENKLVYIVDDDESVCRALKTFLIAYGFEVNTFNSAQSFFDAVSYDAPGCLVLDIHMPVLDGWETHKKIIESGSKLLVIFISAEKAENVADRALKAGAVGYLQKPFDCLALVKLINASENTCVAAQ
jgi:FixJ family two-component response regulator